MAGNGFGTSPPDSALARTERKADLTLSEDGVLEGKLTITFGGIEALGLRQLEWNGDQASPKNLLEKAVKDTVPADVEVDLTNDPDWTSASPSLIAQYHLKLPNWTTPAGRRILLPWELFGSPEKRLFVHADRIHPVYFPYPYLTWDDITITLPSGWTVRSMPDPTNQNSEAVAYALKSEDNAEALHIERTLRVDLVTVPKDHIRFCAGSFRW